MDDNEIRTLLTHIKELPLSIDAVENFKVQLLNNTNVTVINATVLEQNQPIYDKIKSIFGKKKKYK